MRREVFFTRWRLACIAVLLLSALVYLPALTAQFVWDDQQLIRDSGIGKNIGLWDCFTRPFLFHYYRPLGAASLFLENRLFQQRPLYYHQTNLLLHVAATGALLSLLRVAFDSRRIALIGGLLFALDPAQVGAVAFVGGRVDSLSVFWLICFGLALVCSAKAAAKPRAVLLGVALLCFLLALLSKEQTLATLPLVPLAFLCFSADPERERRRAAAKATVPFLIVGAVFVGVWWSVAPPMRGETTLGLAGRAALFGQTLTFYALLLLFPSPQGMHTLSLGTLDAQGGWPIAFGYLSLGLLLFLAWRWRRDARPAFWFLAWVFLTLLPVANLLLVPGLPVAPYRASAAAVGVCALLAWALGSALRWPAREAGEDRRGLLRFSVAAAAGIALLLWHGGLTAAGVRRWESEKTLFEAIVRHDPYSKQARINLAAVALDNAAPQRAVDLLEEWLTLLFGPTAWRTGETLEETLRSQPRVRDRVQKSGANLIAPSRKIAEIYTQLGTAYLQMEKLDRSEEAYRIAYRLDSGNPAILLGLGNVAFQRKDYAGAEEWLRRSWGRNSSFVVAGLTLGKVYAAQRRWAEARDAYLRCRQNAPENILAYLPLAEAQWNLNEREEALETLAQARRFSLLKTEAERMLQNLREAPSAH